MPNSLPVQAIPGCYPSGITCLKLHNYHIALTHIFFTKASDKYLNAIQYKDCLIKKASIRGLEIHPVQKCFPVTTNGQLLRFTIDKDPN